MPPAKGHIDQRLTAEAEKVARGETVEGRYLTYFLSQTGLPMKTVYSNVTELLLAGVDTVRAIAVALVFASFCRRPCRSINLPCASAFSDLQYSVLVLVRAVPPPRSAGLPPGRGAECAGGSGRPVGGRRSTHASPEGHGQRSAEVHLKKFQLVS